MTKYTLDDARMVRMYNMKTPVTTIASTFGVDNGTIYRHLKTSGVAPNRKLSVGWSPAEERQLIDARKDGCTGRELQERVPTRSLVACKGHLRKMGIR